MSKDFTINTKLTVEDKVSTAFKGIAERVGVLSKQFKAVSNAANNVGVGIRNFFPPLSGVLSGAVIYTGIRNFKNLTLQTAALGASIDKTARQVNFGVENFQLWQYVAQKNGASAEGFTSSLYTLNKGMAQLSAGTGNMLSSVKQVSPNLVKQLKATKGTEEAFDLMVKAIRKIEDPAKKDYLALAAFGQSGKELIKMANQSPEALEKLREAMRKTGIFSKEGAENSSRLNGALGNIKTAFGGLTTSMADTLFPVLSEQLTKITENLQSGELKKIFSDLFKDIATSLKGVDFVKITKDIISLVKGIIWFIDFVAGSKPKLIALVTFMNTGLIMSIGKLIASFWGLKSAAIATAKFGIKRLWFEYRYLNRVLTKNLTKLLANIRAHGLLKGVILPLGTAIKTTVVAAFVGLKNAFVGAVIATWNFTAALLACPLTWLIIGIAGVIGALYALWKYWDTVSKMISDVWNSVVKGFWGVWNWAINGILDMLGPFKETFVNIFGFIKEYWSALFGIFMGDLSGIIKLINNVKGWFLSDQPEAIEAKAVKEIQLTNPDGTTPMITGGARKSEAEVHVVFDNMPRGARVESDIRGGGIDLGVEHGYALPAGVR
jgi:hypothetical protein